MAEPTQAKKIDWIDRLQTFDRRWIFLAMGLAIVVPLLLPMNLPVKASPPVKAIYYAVDALDEGDVVGISLDLDPASTPELEPFYRAAILQLKRKGVKLVIFSAWYAAPPLAERWIKETVERSVAGEKQYVRDVDFVWLGFREGKEAMIANMGQSMWTTFGEHDAAGTPFSRLPLMQRVRRLSDLDLIVLVSAGFPGAKEYVQQVQSRYDLKMLAACTAVSTTDLAPYYASGQLLGLAGGMSAAAEYERLVGVPGGLGAKGIDVLNVGHLVVIAAIVFGNIIYFLARRRERRGVVR
jgi:hypothetical protein